MCQKRLGVLSRRYSLPGEPTLTEHPRHAEPPVHCVVLSSGGPREAGAFVTRFQEGAGFGICLPYPTASPIRQEDVAPGSGFPVPSTTASATASCLCRWSGATSRTLHPVPFCPPGQLTEADRVLANPASQMKKLPAVVANTPACSPRRALHVH